MRESLLKRRLIGATARMLVVVLVLLGRLLVPAADMAAEPDPADAVAALALTTICHAAAEDGGTAPEPAHHDACPTCPACHLAAHVILRVSDGPTVRPPTAILIGTTGMLPFKTGPPSRPRRAAPPTGPPTLSA